MNDLKTEDITLSTSENLYQLVAKQLKESGENLPCTMNALKLYADEPRADLDYLKLINLDNRSLLDACYTISFNTFPPAEFILQWENDIDTLPKEAFHKKFMNAFVRLEEYKKQHVRLRNCIYIVSDGKALRPARIRAGIGARVREWTYRTFLPLFKRLPESWKKLLKRLFWKYFFVQ